MNINEPVDTLISEFQQKVFAYYERHGRDLPWRNTTDPYHILLSEVMLQQTQADRVITYYRHWTTRWPTITDLAGAARSDVLSAWMGLGYNNRAINLHEAAKKIVADFNADVLLACHHYKHIKGIGPYTSAAVRIFSNNDDIVTVDTNIRRILIHEFTLPTETTDKELWTLAQQCLPLGRSREWHNALMDYGATHLTARRSGIKPKTKQSTFEGSDRQIRARIIRHLLAHKRSTFTDLTPYTSGDTSRLAKIISTLERDRVIAITNNKIRLCD